MELFLVNVSSSGDNSILVGAYTEKRLAEKVFERVKVDLDIRANCFDTVTIVQIECNTELISTTPYGGRLISIYSI